MNLPVKDAIFVIEIITYSHVRHKNLDNMRTFDSLKLKMETNKVIPLSRKLSGPLPLREPQGAGKRMVQSIHNP